MASKVKYDRRIKKYKLTTSTKQKKIALENAIKSRIWMIDRSEKITIWEGGGVVRVVVVARRRTNESWKESGLP